MLAPFAFARASLWRARASKRMVSKPATIPYPPSILAISCSQRALTSGARDDDRIASENF